MPDLLRRTITGFSNFVKRRGTGARGNSKLIHCVFPVETKVFAIAFGHRNAEIGVLQIQFDHEVLGYQNVHKRRNSFHFEVCIPDWLIDWLSFFRYMTGRTPPLFLAARKIWLTNWSWEGSTICTSFFSSIFDTSILSAVSEPLKRWDWIPSFVEVPEGSLFPGLSQSPERKDRCDNFPVW